MPGPAGQHPFAGSIPASARARLQIPSSPPWPTLVRLAGALGVEVLGYGNWYDAPLPLIEGGKATYFGAEIPFDLGTLIAGGHLGVAPSHPVAITLLLRQRVCRCETPKHGSTPSAAQPSPSPHSQVQVRHTARTVPHPHLPLPCLAHPRRS